jgi:hypothetical protein
MRNSPTSSGKAAGANGTADPVTPAGFPDSRLSDPDRPRLGCEQFVSRPEELVTDVDQRNARPGQGTDHGAQERPRATEIVSGLLSRRVAGEPVGGDDATLVILAAEFVVCVRCTYMRRSTSSIFSIAFFLFQ